MLPRPGTASVTLDGTDVVNREMVEQMMPSIQSKTVNTRSRVSCLQVKDGISDTNHLTLRTGFVIISLRSIKYIAASEIQT